MLRMQYLAVSMKMNPQNAYDFILKSLWCFHTHTYFCGIAERQLREIEGKFISVRFRADGVASICNRTYNAFLPRNLSLSFNIISPTTSIWLHVNV